MNCWYWRGLLWIVDNGILKDVFVMLVFFVMLFGVLCNVFFYLLCDDLNVGCVGDWGCVWWIYWGIYVGIFFERFVLSVVFVNNMVFNR